MDTVIKSQSLSSQNLKVKTAAAQNPSTQSEFWKRAEFNRFGIIPMLLVFLVCMGGIATAYGAGSDTMLLSLVVFPTIIGLALVLAVAPMRYIIWVSAIAVLLDLVVLLIGF
jgi:hypothetical protein